MHIPSTRALRGLVTASCLTLAASVAGSGAIASGRPVHQPVEPARPALEAAVAARPTEFGECVPTDAAWGLEPDAQCVWAAHAHLDGDDSIDVTAIYRVGGPGGPWNTATWTSTGDAGAPAVGPLLGSDGQPLVDGADAYPYRIEESVDPNGDHRGAVQVVEFTGANTLTLSWQTAVDDGPLQPVVDFG